MPLGEICIVGAGRSPWQWGAEGQGEILIYKERHLVEIFSIFVWSGLIAAIRLPSASCFHSNIHIVIYQSHINVNCWYLYTYNEYIIYM